MICCDYTWPRLCDFVKSYCKSCTTCMRAKPQRHKPYGLLKQLPIPERLWNSISMDFIETLPMSSGCDSILVIVDCLSKQSIFIPTTVHCTSEDLAQIFIMHVFSKHGVPSHVTSDRGSEFILCFFRSLGKALDMKLHFTSGYHPEGDGQTKRLIKLWSNILGYFATTSKTTGICYYCWQNLLTTMLQVPPLVSLRSFPTKVIIQTSPSILRGT